MKYMTPELLARYQSANDEAALAAYDEWQAAGERYRAELDVIRDKLPPAALLLVDRFCLHDARVVGVGVGANALAFILVLDGEGGGLHLEYDLVQPVALTPHPEIAEDCPLEWLYDEFALGGEEGGGAFVHSILFTNGSELRLVFRSMRCGHYSKTLFMGGVAMDASDAGRKFAELLVA